MSGISQHLRKPALLAVLVAMLGSGAASAMAALAAASGPKPFELVLNADYENGNPALGLLGKGAFTAKAPFCESGSAADMDLGVRRFECADGSGSITLDLGYPQPPFGGAGDWRILEGSGQYAGLRGKGTFWDEFVCNEWDSTEYWCVDMPADPYRSTFYGVVADDAVAPTIGLASATASKVSGTKGVYTIAAALDFRDNVEDNPVSYTVSVRRESGAGPWLAFKSGEATGAISFEFRVRRPLARVQTLLIRTTAVDPIGNESTLDVRVTLPR